MKKKIIYWRDLDGGNLNHILTLSDFIRYPTSAKVTLNTYVKENDVESLVKDLIKTNEINNYIIAFQIIKNES